MASFFCFRDIFNYFNEETVSSVERAFYKRMSWVRAPHCFFSLLTTSYEKEKTYEIRNFSCIETYGKNGE